MEAHNPDVICIVETWLCADVLDSEIALPGYQVYGRDRNRHGGGVLIYVRNNFVCNILPSADNLEIITVSICHGPSKVFISLFYQPPNSLLQVSEDLFLYLQSLNVGSFYKYILLGDFNVNFGNQTHSKLYSIFESFCLSQVTLIWVPMGLPPCLISLPHHLLLSCSLVRLFLHLPTLIIWAYYYNHTGGKLDSLEVVLLDRSGYTNMQTGTKLVNLLRTQTGIPFLLMMSTLHGKIG